VVETEEQTLIEQLVPHPAIEAFAKTILHGFAGRDEVPGHSVLLRPGKHDVRCELGAVIRDDHAGLAAPFDQRRQLSSYAPSRDRGIRDGREAFPGNVVDDVQDAEAPATGELIVHKVQRPARIGLRLKEDRRPGPDRASPGPALAHREALLAIETVDAVDAGRLAVPPQQDEQSPIAKPPALIGQITQLRS
jgi:hypothetical protein